MKNIIPVLIALLVSFSACKGQKETTHREPVDRFEVPAINPDQYETTRPSTVQSAPSSTSPEIIVDDNIPKSEVHLEPLDVPDSLLVSFERTPCYGMCPTFRFNIYKSGFAEFEGIRFVDSIGNFTAQVSQERLGQVVELARQIKYFEMNDSYDNPYITDIPAAITIVQIDGRLKRIMNRHEGTPQDLVIFEKFLDGIVQELGFHTPKNKPHDE